MKFFILWYGYDVDAIYTVGGTLGVFSDYEYAVLAKEKYSLGIYLLFKG